MRQLCVRTISRTRISSLWLIRILLLYSFFLTKSSSAQNFYHAFYYLEVNKDLLLHHICSHSYWYNAAISNMFTCCCTLINKQNNAGRVFFSFIHYNLEYHDPQQLQTLTTSIRKRLPQGTRIAHGTKGDPTPPLPSWHYRSVPDTSWESLPVKSECNWTVQARTHCESSESSTVLCQH